MCIFKSVPFRKVNCPIFRNVTRQPKQHYTRRRELIIFNLEVSQMDVYEDVINLKC